MTDLTPVSSFDNVVEHPTTALLLAGPSGPLNQQAQSLLNRTEYLRDSLLSLQQFDTLLGDGVTPGEGSNKVAYTAGMTVFDALNLLFITVAANFQRDYGAAGVGGDETSAFTAAYADLASGAIKSLYIPSGTYLDTLSRQVSVNGCAIFGDGVDATIILRTDGGYGSTLTVARSSPTTQQLAGFTLRDLTFYCQADMSTGDVISLQNVTRVFIDRVFIRNCHRGIHTEGIRDSRIRAIEIIQGEHYTVDRATACHFFFDMPKNPALKSTETFIEAFNFTTAGNPGDVDSCFKLAGDFDGLWLNNGHWFGGKQSGFLCDATGVNEMRGLLMSQVWCDQFTPVNMLFKGAATDPTKFGGFKITGGRVWGGSVNNIVVEDTCNIGIVRYIGTEIGQNIGNGCLIAGGNFSFEAVDFDEINQDATASGYAIRVPGTIFAGTSLKVKGGNIDCSDLEHGINLASTTAYYDLHDISFHSQAGGFVNEINYSGATLNGTCSGHSTGRTTVGDVAAAATTTLSNLATDSVNLTGGSTINVATFRPVWHGRRVTFKANAIAQNIVSGGNFRNKLNAASVAIAAADCAIYEYRSDTARWHEL